MNISGLVHKSAIAAPDTAAVIDLGQTFTYADVAKSVGQHAQALTLVGVKPGNRVGVHFNKSAAGFIAMHAVVSAGAVAVPLDPTSPPSRLARICADVDISVVLTHSPRRKSIQALHELRPLHAVIGLGAPASQVDTPASQVDAGFTNMTPDDVALLDGQDPVDVSPDALAYIITTSGSTGDPKGIAHTHSSGRAYADMVINTYGVHAQDRIADISPHHFDISTFSLWATPLAGATNVVINEAYQRLPASHSQLLQDEAVTIWYSVPFLIQQLVLRGDLTNRNLDALRWVHFGGEVLPTGMLIEMMNHCANARFANIFGPAEVNNCTTAIFDMAPEPNAGVSIGFPVGDVQVRLIEPAAEVPDDKSVVKDGEVGQLWVATRQMMAGYWDRDDMNAAVIKNVDGTAYYPTGDLVSSNEHGELAFHGRADNQVKVRGFRIELEGIEADLETLVHQDSTAESVVVSVMRTDSGEDQLVAGVLGANAAFDIDDFSRSAAAVVPAYAVPTQTVLLTAPEFTGSGKLDRRVLRDNAVALAKQI